MRVIGKFSPWCYVDKSALRLIESKKVKEWTGNCEESSLWFAVEWDNVKNVPKLRFPVHAAGRLYSL